MFLKGGGGWKAYLAHVIITVAKHTKMWFVAGISRGIGGGEVLGRVAGECGGGDWDRYFILASELYIFTVVCVFIDCQIIIRWCMSTTALLTSVNMLTKWQGKKLP